MAYLYGQETPFQPGDERNGDYTRDQLERMDERFRERLERAIACGKERPDAQPKLGPIYAVVTEGDEVKILSQRPGGSTGSLLRAS